MRYAKPALTFEQQADLLLERGMSGDRSTIIDRLRSVNYYRLSGYWYTMRIPASDRAGVRSHQFAPGTTFDDVWRRYVFDRQLRLLVMDAIERIEVGVRSQLAYHHAHQFGPFGYAADSSSLGAEKQAGFVEKVREELGRNSHLFAEHFSMKYGDQHPMPPIWMAVEIVSFGGVLTLYRGCQPDIRSKVAGSFGVHHRVFDSWLMALNTVRNICAHHGRLWNRTLGVKPRLPNKNAEWIAKPAISNDKVYCVLCICAWSLRQIAPQSGWKQRLAKLLDDASTIPLRSMGIPEGWEGHPFWS
ncbi:MAG: Abi family protein [Planctomycetia bacterium]|jgi:abortive infection bacteriophage resistance protein